MSSNNIFPDLPDDVAQVQDAPAGVDSGMRALYHSLRLAFTALVIIIIGATIYFFTLGGYVAVPPQEKVIVLRFGAYHATLESGPHWFFPYPVNQFIWIKTAPQELKVEYIAAPNAGDSLIQGVDGFLLTSDTNIIHTSWSFSYSVVDARQYYTSVLTPRDPRSPDVLVPFMNTPPTGRGPQTLLKSIFNNAAVTATAQMGIDQLLENQSEYEDRVGSLFARAVYDMNLGVVIDRVSLQSIDPPGQANEAFSAVSAAGNESSTMISRANSEAIQLRNAAEAEASSIVQSAESYRLNASEELKSELLYFNKIREEVEKNGPSILVVLYNNALAEAVQNVSEKFFVTPGEDGNYQLRMRLSRELLPTAAPERRLEPTRDLTKSAVSQTAPAGSAPAAHAPGDKH